MTIANLVSMFVLTLFGSKALLCFVFVFLAEIKCTELKDGLVESHVNNVY